MFYSYPIFYTIILQIPSYIDVLWHWQLNRHSLQFLFFLLLYFTSFFFHFQNSITPKHNCYKFRKIQPRNFNLCIYRTVKIKAELECFFRFFSATASCSCDARFHGSPVKCHYRAAVTPSREAGIMPWSHLCVKPPRMSNVRQI